MADSYITNPSADGFKNVIDFGSFLEELHNSLTGRRYKLVPAGKIKLPDGTEQDQFINQLQEADALAPFSDQGADYVVGEVRMFMNKHTAMADLNNDQRCRRLAADITNNMVSEVESSPSTYGCSEEKFGMVNFRMRNLTRSLYATFTAMKNGAILDFGKSTTGSSTIIREDVGGSQPSQGISVSRK